MNCRHRCCPPCILQDVNGYVGYPLYPSLFGGMITGLGTGGIAFFSKIKSLKGIIPLGQRRLALVSVICYVIFAGINIVTMMTSNLIMEG
ncbi:MAG: hypothetical protein PHI06_09420 [Desulfobulbaceae bacterium]|nr:hypothetical protein [Desulfobulbaceae bacterium]